MSDRYNNLTLSCLSMGNAIALLDVVRNKIAQLTYTQ